MRRRGAGRAAAAVVAALVAVSVGACLRPVGPGVAGRVDEARSSSDTLRLTYLGTGGWIIEHGSDQILTGPLFSNPGLFRTGLWPISADLDEIDRHMSRYDVSGARAILVGHGHYDHAMDVPRVALEHAPRARILTSRTVANTYGTWSGVHDRVDVANDSIGDQERAGGWFRYGAGVRVMPLHSHHAPHFEEYTLYRGTRDRPLAEPPRYASEWLDGRTLAFLVDFMASPDSVAFRLYYQDAVVAAPAGLAPETLIAERPVDVAILVPATFDQVGWHPEALIDNLEPRKVLLGHWEDFFVPVDDSTRSIPLTDVRHFEERLERVFDGAWWRPDLWTEFRFPGS